MQVIWTDPALERVDETAVYIARDDPAAADRWTLELFAAVERLIDFPESGRMVPELAPRDVRELIFGAYPRVLSCRCGRPCAFCSARESADSRA